MTKRLEKSSVSSGDRALCHLLGFNEEVNLVDTASLQPSQTNFDIIRRHNQSTVRR